MRARAALASGLVALAAAAACYQPPVCYDGEYRACSCGNKTGYQACAAQQFGACACDGTTPGLSGGASTSTGMSTSTSATTGGGQAPLYAPCAKNADCASGNCGDFPAKGPHCTKTCASNADCPPPSPGCNPKGQCRLL